MSELRIGTRGSALALAQSDVVRRALQQKNPRLRFRLVKIKTMGDEFQGVELFRKNGIGVFTKAIEKKLLSGHIDIAVHSLKDLPTQLAKGLVLGAIPKRFPVEDVLISRRRLRLKQLPFGAKVGTGSPRRKRQLLRLRPDLNVVDLRGNLDTRVNKVIKQKELHAIVVAKAGLMRLKKFLRYSSTLPPEKMLPAVGQGALGIQIRGSDTCAWNAVRKIHDPSSEKIVNAERVFLRTLHGGCRVPMGVYCRFKNNRFQITASVFSMTGPEVLTAKTSSSISKCEQAAERLALLLLKRGAKKLLSDARSDASLSLSGIKIVVTRMREKSGVLADKFRDLGAHVLEYPVIRIEKKPDLAAMDEALMCLDQQDWLVFTSAYGVEAFFERLREKKRAWQALAGVQIACVGAKTADALSSEGLRAALVPTRSETSALLEAFQKMHLAKGKNFLLLRTDIAPPLLEAGLKKLGAKVRHVTAYRTRTMRWSSKQKKSLNDGVHVVTFTSSSCVTGFVKAFGASQARQLSYRSSFVSIGPVTTGAMRQCGLRVSAQAKQFDPEGLVLAVRDLLEKH